MSFRGAYTSVITPFRDGEIDRAVFQALIVWRAAIRAKGEGRRAFS